MLICCLIAEGLNGSSLWRKRGSKFIALDPDLAASFASLSAASFPVDPMCPAIQVSEITIFGLFPLLSSLLADSSTCNLVMSRLISSIRYCAGWGLFAHSGFMVAWLSILRSMLSRVPLILRTRWSPSIIAIELY